MSSNGYLFAAALLLSGFAAGCASRPERPPWQRPVELESPPAAASRKAPVSDTQPYQINDYLIYPVKWLRAEEVAATVEPLFQARYGPGVMVIPHVPTNKLLIYLPPPQERERTGAAGTPATTRAGLRSRGTSGASRGATTRRSVTPSSIRR